MAAAATLSEKTLMPVGIGVSACGLCVAVTLWVSNRFVDSDQKMQDRMARMEQNQILMQNTLDATLRELRTSWDESRMEAWTLRLQLNNPDLTVPGLSGQGVIR